jgi:hypothetical protein
VSVQSFLELDVDVVGSMVYKDAASRIHFLVRSLSFGCEQATFIGAHKVVRQNLLSNKEMILSNCASFVLDNSSADARSGACGLFPKLTSSTSTWMNNLTRCSV